MTAETFRQNIKRIYKTDDITNYVVSVLLLGVGLYFLIKILYNGLLTREVSEKHLILLVPLIPIFAALYAFWRIPKDYIVYQIDSNLPKEEKLKVIESYLTDVEVIWKSIEGSYRSYRYRNKLWSKVDLRFCVDDAKVLYNVQGADVSGLKGIFDFGLTKRATKKLTKYLNSCL